MVFNINLDSIRENGMWVFFAIAAGSAIVSVRHAHTIKAVADAMNDDAMVCIKKSQMDTMMKDVAELEDLREKFERARRLYDEGKEDEGAALAFDSAVVAQERAEQVESSIAREQGTARRLMEAGSKKRSLLLGASASGSSSSSFSEPTAEEAANEDMIASKYVDAMCSLTRRVRTLLTAANAPWWNRSVHVLPNQPPLLVPIQKLAAAPKDVAAELHKRHRESETYAKVAKVVRNDYKLSDVESAAASIAAAPLVWRPWPARAVFDDHAMAWERFEEGALWKTCRTGSSAHWYCTHITKAYYDKTMAIYTGCIEPTGIFKRPDVRLVLDVGGSTGAFAEAVYKWHGDRVLVMTGSLWAAENDAKYGHQFPQNGVLAARGYPGVMMDMYSYFPFGESTLDCVHTSWTFHTGFPKATLYEVHRVLRPGGYFIIRQMMNTEMFLEPVRRFAKQLNWTTLLDSKGCKVEEKFHAYETVRDTVIVFRMPLPPLWKHRVFGSSWFG